MLINRESKAIIATFSIIFLYSSYTVTNNIVSSATTIFLWIVLFFMLLFMIKRLNRNVFVLGMALSLFTFITHSLNDDIGKHFTVYVFSIVVSIAYVSAFRFDEFRDSYIKIMYVIAVVSLIGFSACLIVPEIGTVFSVRSPNGIDYTYWVIFVNKIASIHSATPRNYGMFWEPGAYQTFLNLALLLEILKGKSNKRHILAFILAALTTVSTTGYLALAVIMTLAIVRKKISDPKTRNMLIGMSCFLLLFVIVSPDLRNAVFGKVSNFILNEEYLSERRSGSSAAVRFFSVIKPLEVFLEKPFFGMGYKGVVEKTWDYLYGMPTCTFINWLAMYGLFYGMIMVGGFIRFAEKISHHDRIASILSFICLFVITMSENYVNVPVFFILVFYGISSDKAQCKEWKASKECQYAYWGCGTV